MYIFRYNIRLTGELIGYHTSTFCQTTKERERAKRYGCVTPEEVASQMKVISNNLKSTLAKTEEDTKKEGLAGVMAALSFSVKNEHFKDMKFEDIELLAEEVSYTEQKLIVNTIIANGQVSTVNLPLEEVLKTVIKDATEGPHEREKSKL